jgi:glycosyltransferase involved in cell wall biosynthesis
MKRGDQVRFVAHQGIDQLIEHYQSASVHASVSWYDTPGLVNLEAGMCGCPLVIGTEGSSSEYFKDLAWYADPADPESIRRAVEHAMNDEFVSERTSSLQQRVAENFTWHHAAQATLDGYKRALSSMPI